MSINVLDGTANGVQRMFGNWWAVLVEHPPSWVLCGRSWFVLGWVSVEERSVWPGATPWSVVCE